MAKSKPKKTAKPRQMDRTVAAAPELLAALKDLMTLYKQGQLVIEGEVDEGDDPVVSSAFRAIAKAEGRGE